MPQRSIGDLSFELGVMEFNDAEIYTLHNHSGEDHRFIIENRNSIVVMHLRWGYRHADIAKHLGLKPYVGDEEVVGGGRFYISERASNLHDFSTNYGGVPKPALEKFSELLVPELKKRGYSVDVSTVESVDEEFLNPFWDQFGF